MQAQPPRPVAKVPEHHNVRATFWVGDFKRRQGIQKGVVRWVVVLNHHSFGNVLEAVIVMVWKLDKAIQRTLKHQISNGASNKLDRVVQFVVLQHAAVVVQYQPLQKLRRLMHVAVQLQVVLSVGRQRHFQAVVNCQLVGVWKYAVACLQVVSVVHVVKRKHPVVSKLFFAPWCAGWPG